MSMTAAQAYALLSSSVVDSDALDQHGNCVPVLENLDFTRLDGIRQQYSTAEIGKH